MVVGTATQIYLSSAVMCHLNRAIDFSHSRTVFPNQGSTKNCEISK
jgi:hypothetical protein